MQVLPWEDLYIRQKMFDYTEYNIKFLLSGLHENIYYLLFYDLLLAVLDIPFCGC